ncbi:MAG: efflux RND transporter periplasmic adaptor subunit [Phycisphaerae bacterium]
MNAPSETRAQLQTLKIPKSQRPASARRRGRRTARWLLLLAVLAGAGGAAYWKRDRLGPYVDRLLAPAPAQARLLTVESRATPPPLLTATGKIVSDHQVEVATKVSGQISALFFEQGDHVKAGQRLALIEDVAYRARRDQAAAELQKSKAALEFRRVNFERTERLYKEASAPEIEYADARRALDEAVAQVAANQAALDWAQKMYSDCEVLAPIDGVILERNVEVGDFVAAEGGRGAMANAQFAAIADMSKLRVEVDVSELDVARLRKDLPCQITPEAYKDRVYRGHVLWLDPGANYAKATVQVKVRILNPDEYLRVEGSAQVVFLMEDPGLDPATRPAPRVWIPASACAPEADGRTAKVLVVVKDRLQEAVVRLGRKAGGQVEILEGLEPGQRIVAADLDQYHPGQRVQQAG